VHSALLFNDTSSVVSVLNLHSGEARDIDGVLDAHATVLLAESHVHIEGLVGLALAVAHAELLTIGLSSEGLGVDAVHVALAEEELGQRELLKEGLLKSGHY
jgi:hypothetical protein